MFNNLEIPYLTFPFLFFFTGDGVGLDDVLGTFSSTAAFIIIYKLNCKKQKIKNKQNSVIKSEVCRCIQCVRVTRLELYYRQQLPFKFCYVR